MDWLHIFTAGRRTSGNGVEVDFSDDVLAGIAATYDPGVHEAPLVIGHPKLDAPAYGWVGQMRANGERLEVAPVQVEAQFADMVNEGRFKKRSASFYLPTSPRHPLRREGQAAPEFPYLRHVGFLGAAAPAVAGLDREVQFAGDEDGVVEVEFASDYAVSGLLKIARRLRDFIVERFGADEAEKVVPAEDLDWITEAQAYDAAVDSVERRQAVQSTPTFSEKPAPAEEPTNPDPTPMADPKKDTAEYAQREAQLKEREDALAAREAKLQEQADEAKRKEIANFADGLANDNARILPRHVPVVTAALEALEGVRAEDAGTVQFGEGDDADQVTPAEGLRRMLKEFPEQVQFGEQAATTVAQGDDSAAVADFAVPAGHQVDKAGAKLHAKAVAYQKANPGTEFIDAVRAVQK